MNKLSSIFQNGPDLPRTGSQLGYEDKLPSEDQAAAKAEKPSPPVESPRIVSAPRLDERRNFGLAKALLSRAADSAANSFVGLLQSQTTPADLLRRTLEEVIEYRAADAALTKVAEDTALRTICLDAKNFGRPTA
jgi:hypothetical protein